LIQIWVKIKHLDNWKHFGEVHHYKSNFGNLQQLHSIADTSNSLVQSRAIWNRSIEILVQGFSTRALSLPWGPRPGAFTSLNISAMILLSPIYEQGAQV